MGKEKAERIQTSLLNAAEKKVLIYLAERQPKWMTSDGLTYIGVLGALVCAAGFALSTVNIYYLWLANLGLVINWYGDSLDGTLARVRNAQRPKYGFFIDHSLDVVTVTLMIVGAGLSPIFSMVAAMSVLIGYLALSIYTYVTTIVNDQFRLTYGVFGPTEFRLIFVILNIVIMYTSLSTLTVEIGSCSITVCDLVAYGVAAILAIIWFSQFFADKARLAKLDPLKK